MKRLFYFSRPKDRIIELYPQGYGGIGEVYRIILNAYKNKINFYLMQGKGSTKRIEMVETLGSLIIKGRL